jgi:hypothetical protein
MTIMNFAVGHLTDGRAEFEIPLCAVIRHCGLPFIKSSATEADRKLSTLRDTVRAVASMLMYSNDRVQIAAAEVRGGPSSRMLPRALALPCPGYRLTPSPPLLCSLLLLLLL